MSAEQLQVLFGLLELWPLWLAGVLAIAITWGFESGVFLHDKHFH